MVPVSRPDISDREISLVNNALTSTWISSTGSFLDAFETGFAAANFKDFCLATSNGTVALHLALLGLGIKPGDEVIVPSFTYIASVNCIQYCGATPVFADIDPSNLCISTDSVNELITTRTKAVIAVHLYGKCADVLTLRKICDQNSIFLIEDVAEAPFAKRDGHQAGELGDIATFSFFGNKIISSGEGGAVTTSNQELLMKMKILRSQGMDPNTRYFFSEIGFNYRLTNVAAAILVGQLERLSEMWERRMLLYSSYKEVLQKFDFLELQNVEENEVVSPWLFPVLLDSETRRNTIMARLLDCGIDSRPFFIPVHSLPMYRSIPIRGDMKITDDIAYRGMNLPTSSAFSELEIQTLLIGIQKVFEDE